MLRALRRLWEGYAASIPKSEVVDSVPESQWGRADLLPTVSKAKRQAFTSLLALVYSHLTPLEAEALVKRGADAFTRADEADSALREALLPEETDGVSKSLGFIACDWKAAEEVEWQANLLCQAHGISERWSAPPGGLPRVLQSFDLWLSHHERRLLCFSDGDTLVAFALREDQVASAIALGKKLKLAIENLGEA